MKTETTLALLLLSSPNAMLLAPSVANALTTASRQTKPKQTRLFQKPIVLNGKPMLLVLRVQVDENVPDTRLNSSPCDVFHGQDLISVALYDGVTKEFVRSVLGTYGTQKPGQTVRLSRGSSMSCHSTLLSLWTEPSFQAARLFTDARDGIIPLYMGEGNPTIDLENGVEFTLLRK